jgi:hypothetical protein
MVTLMQTERTYEVTYNEKDYMVTILTDIDAGIVEYVVFDPMMDLVENSQLEIDIIRYVEDNIN